MLAAEQQTRREADTVLLDPAAIAARLSKAGRDKAKPVRPEEQFEDPAGKVFLKTKREGRAGVVFTVPAALTVDRKAVAEATDLYLQRPTSNR